MDISGNSRNKSRWEKSQRIQPLRVLKMVSSQLYVCFMILFGIGMAFIGFHYINQMERKHTAMAEIYELEAKIRLYKERLVELEKDFHVYFAYNNLDPILKAYGLELKPSQLVYDLKGDAPEEAVVESQR